MGAPRLEAKQTPNQNFRYELPSSLQCCKGGKIFALRNGGFVIESSDGNQIGILTPLADNPHDFHTRLINKRGFSFVSAHNQLVFLNYEDTFHHKNPNGNVIYVSMLDVENPNSQFKTIEIELDIIVYSQYNSSSRYFAFINQTGNKIYLFDVVQEELRSLNLCLSLSTERFHSYFDRTRVQFLSDNKILSITDERYSIFDIDFAKEKATLNESYFFKEITDGMPAYDYNVQLSPNEKYLAIRCGFYVEIYHIADPRWRYLEKVASYRVGKYYRKLIWTPDSQGVIFPDVRNEPNIYQWNFLKINGECLPVFKLLESDFDATKFIVTADSELVINNRGTLHISCIPSNKKELTAACLKRELNDLPFSLDLIEMIISYIGEPYSLFALVQKINSLLPTPVPLFPKAIDDEILRQLIEHDKEKKQDSIWFFKDQHQQRINLLTQLVKLDKKPTEGYVKFLQDKHTTYSAARLFFNARSKEFKALMKNIEALDQPMRECQSKRVNSQIF